MLPGRGACTTVRSGEILGVRTVGIELNGCFVTGVLGFDEVTSAGVDSPGL